MIGLLDLKKLRARLARVDRHIFSTLGVRLGEASLSDAVAEVKRKQAGPVYPILRKEIEERRLAMTTSWAQDFGLDPDFAAALMYNIISESCRTQAMFMFEHFKDRKIDEDDPDAVWRFQRKELIRLTDAVASTYDACYDQSYFGTKIYRDFETGQIGSLVERLGEASQLDVAVDLGCATGRKSFRLAHSFKQVIGYDISPAMIKQAEEKRNKDEIGKKISFKKHDIEKGIPRDDSSTSFVLINLGTASDIRNIDNLLAEIHRVLTANGMFMLSFYNAGSLLSALGFLPWPAPLAALIDQDKNCLEVHFNDDVFLLYAKPYTVNKLQELFIQHSLRVEKCLTHPTISSVLPEDILSTDRFESYGDISETESERCLPAKIERQTNDNAMQAIKQIDEALAASPLNLGAYIIVIGGKSK